MGNERATLLVNPMARGVPREYDWTRVVRFLTKRGVETRLAIPATPAAARAEALQSVGSGDDWLFVVGGDGSLRVAASALRGSDTALAALPMGTVNVWARETGIPRGLRAALECHLGGQLARIDVGRAADGRFAGECFLLMASIGWDAAVVRDVPASLKRRFGDVAYLVQGARMLRGVGSQAVEWSADGVAMGSRLAMLVVSNTRLYGGRVMFTPDARPDDGILDYVGLAPSARLHMAALATRLLTRRLHDSSEVVTGQARSIKVATAGLPVQFDGDYVGETPICLVVEHRALTVSVPAGPLPPLLRARPDTPDDEGREQRTSAAAT